jgi:hypothetical protein
MANRKFIASLFAAGGLLLTLPSPLPGQISSAPTLAQCMPQVGGPPVPCATARAGQTIRLLVTTTNLPYGPITLLFAQQSADGRPGISTRTTLPGEVSRDGAYEVPVPRELCAGKTAVSETFDIQHLATEVNQEDGTGPSLGTLTVAC